MYRIRTDFSKILISFVILYSIMPIVNRLTSRYATTYGYLLVVLLLFVMIMLRHSKSVNLYFNVLLPMIAYEALTFFLRSDSLVLWGYKVLLFLLPATLGYYLIYERSENNKSFSFVIILSIVITIITTIRGCMQFPSAARYLATVDSADEYLAVLYSMRNIGGYDFVYTVTLLYPLLVYAYKIKRIRLPVFAIVAVSILALILVSEYTTALLLFIITSVLIFAKRDLKSKNLMGLLVTSIIVVFLFNGVVSNVLKQLSAVIKSEDISYRLSSLAGGIGGLESSEDNRIVLYRRSLNTFFTHPFLGTFLSGGGGIGGHSSILDSLAQYGIIGLMLIYNIYKRVYYFFFKPFRNAEGYGYFLWLFLQCVLLSAINTGLWLNVLTLYAPLIFLNINRKEGISYEGSLDR